MVLPLVYWSTMGAKQKHRTASNSYNLRCKVELPIEVQLKNDSAFLNEFASQPKPGQSSKSRSDNESNTGIDLETDNLVTQESEDSIEESPVFCQKKNTKNQIGHHISKILDTESMWLQANWIRH